MEPSQNIYQNPVQVQLPPKQSFYKKYLTKKRLAVLLIIASFSLLFLAIYFATRGRQPTPTPSPAEAPTALDLETKNWDTLSQNNFSLKYPKGVTIQQNDNKTTLRYRGSAQADSPELIDGLQIEFYLKNFENNQTLSTIVQSEIQKITNSPLEKITQASQKVQIANLNGYKFTTQGMVETRYYYLKLNDSQYLYIVDSSQSSSGQDFESIVKTILSTLEVK